MGPKLLFVFGIVAAHGALAAGWLAQEETNERIAVSATCARQVPVRPLHIAPPRELLAQVMLQSDHESGVLRP
jgi:predicted MFS family arabinose efflux permease